MQGKEGRAVKQEQEEISPNHVQRINLISVRVSSPWSFRLMLTQINHKKRHQLFISVVFSTALSVNLGSGHLGLGPR